MIIDLDIHLSDARTELWRPYFSKAEAGLIPRVAEVDGIERLEVGGLMFPKPAGPGMGSPLGIGAADLTTPEDVSRYIRRVGIQHAVMLPGFVGLGALTVPDPRARKVLARAHNELVYDLAGSIEGVVFAPVVLPEDPEWSIAELKRWQSRTRVLSAISRPTTLEARPYRDSRHNVLLRYLIDNGLALMLHGATGYHQASPIADHFDDYRFAHVFSHPFEQMVALADLFAHGAIEQGLRVVVLEAGCGWLPWFLTRLQSHFDHCGGCSAIPVSVVELTRERLLLAVEPDDPAISSVLSAVGPSVLGFGSDYPHWDAVSTDALKTFNESYDDDIVNAILYRNACDFLRL